jgi:DNA-binding XRE family transcriptional regulator
MSSPAIIVDLRPIPGWDGYLACSDGTIYSMWRQGNRHGGPHLRDGDPRPLKFRMQTNHYLGVTLARLGSTPICKLAHPLVAAAFHGPRPSGMTASHLNGNRQDNRAENLAWETYADNLARRLEHGTDDRGLRNSRTCMSPERLALVRRRLQEGCTHLSIAQEAGVSRTTISRIYNGHRYQNE